MSLCPELYEAIYETTALRDLAYMCGANKAQVNAFLSEIERFILDPAVAIYERLSKIRRHAPAREYKPRHDISTWTPRLPDKEWWPLTHRVYRRDGRVCRYCRDQQGPFAIDHIVPLCRGGSNDIENLTVACRACNSSKQDKLLSEWEGRYGVHR